MLYTNSAEDDMLMASFERAAKLAAYAIKHAGTRRGHTAKYIYTICISLARRYAEELNN